MRSTKAIVETAFVGRLGQVFTSQNSVISYITIDKNKHMCYNVGIRGGKAPFSFSMSRKSPVFGGFFGFSTLYD